MALYRVLYDAEQNYIEADSISDAVDVWRRFLDAENEDDPIDEDEETESIELVQRGPVWRGSPPTSRQGERGKIKQVGDSGTTATEIIVCDGSLFEVGDLMRPDETSEIILVTGVRCNLLTVVRGYGGTTNATLACGMLLENVGNTA